MAGKLGTENFNVPEQRAPRQSHDTQIEQTRGVPWLRWLAALLLDDLLKFIQYPIPFVRSEVQDDPIDLRRRIACSRCGKDLVPQFYQQHSARCSGGKGPLGTDKADLIRLLGI